VQFGTETLRPFVPSVPGTREPFGPLPDSCVKTYYSDWCDTIQSKRRVVMQNLLMRLWREEQGQDLTEYALLLVLLSLAAIGSLGILANAINATFTNAAANLTT